MADQEADFRLILTGERAVQAGVEATALSFRGLREAVATTNAEMEHQRRRSFLMNQTLFTMRRLLYASTLAMGALGAVAVRMGFQFNMAMENNMVAMTQFLGSEQLARQELASLYELAAKTPFEFSNVTDAARRFLAFGFSLRDTNRYLRIIGDTAAAFGGSTDQLERMVLVFGQMRAAGRVLGQDLLQLEQIGVPVLDILREQLGLTQKQVANIGQLQIPANVAIEAIMRGMDERFRGMAAKQAKTLQGRISTLHDYAAQLFGVLTLPLYNKLRDEIIPELTSLATDMRTAAQAGGVRGALGVIDTRYGSNLVMIFDKLSSAGQSFWTILDKSLIPTLVDLNNIFHPLYSILTAVAAILSVMADHTTATRIALTLLLIEMARFRLTLLLVGAESGGGLLGMLSRGMEKSGQRQTAWRNLFQITSFQLRRMWTSMTRSWSILVRGHVKGATEMIRMTRFQQGVLLRLNSAFSAVTLAGLGWVGVALLIAYVLVVLYTRWKPFHDIVNATAKWLWANYWVLVAIVAVIGTPLTASLIVVYRNWDRVRGVLVAVWHVLRTIVNAARAAAHWLGRVHVPGSGVLGGALHWAGSHLTPALASGGTVIGGGSFLVGERGPEIATLPGGTAVSPISATNFPVAATAAGQQQAAAPLIVELNMDGKRVGRGIARVWNDSMARQAGEAKTITRIT